jgi:hypothetical protein
MPRDYRRICGAGLETKNCELGEVETLCFKQPYWGKRGYTAVERRYSELLVRQRW